MTPTAPGAPWSHVTTGRVEAQHQQAAQGSECPYLPPRVEDVDGRVVRPYYGQARERRRPVGAQSEAGAAVGHSAVGAARVAAGWAPGWGGGAPAASAAAA